MSTYRRRRRRRCSDSGTRRTSSFDRFGSWIKDSDRDQVFGRYADLYETYRPTYPDSVFRTIFDAVHEEFAGKISTTVADAKQTRVRVLDCATGTGRGALKILSLYDGNSTTVPAPCVVTEILGTDVDQGMIDVARSNAAATPPPPPTTDVDFFVAKAETLGTEIARRERKRLDRDILQVRRFRLVTVFQAWHWFDSDRVLKELQERVLVPGGVLAVAWNDRDISIPWVSQLEDLIERYNPKYDRSARQCDGFGPVLTRGGHFELISQTDTAHAMPLIGACDETTPAGALQGTKGEYEATIDAARSLLEMTRTFSYVRNVLDGRASDDELGWDAWERDVLELGRNVQKNEEGAVVMPLKTRLYVLRATAVEGGR